MKWTIHKRNYHFSDNKEEYYPRKANKTYPPVGNIVESQRAAECAFSVSWRVRTSLLQTNANRGGRTHECPKVARRRPRFFDLSEHVITQIPHPSQLASERKAKATTRV